MFRITFCAVKHSSRPTNNPFAVVSQAASCWTELRMRDNLDRQQQPIADFQRESVNENTVTATAALLLE